MAFLCRPIIVVRPILARSIARANAKEPDFVSEPNTPRKRGL